MQVALGSLDRLVDFVERAGGRVRPAEAARHLFAVRAATDAVAGPLLQRLIEQDSRLAWEDGMVALDRPGSPALAEASFVVFDLETTGLAVPASRICEIGAVRIERLEATAEFETLVAPGRPLPRAVGRLTGIHEEALRRSPPIATAMRRFAAFVGDAVLVAHNARFDVAFVNAELERLSGQRLSTRVLDTLPLARNLLGGRAQRLNLAALAHFFGVAVEPCHRALPDAAATAEVFLRLVEVARELGATTVAELDELAAPRAPARRPSAARSVGLAPTARGRPRRPPAH